MFRPRTRWLAVAAATLVVGALLPASAALADTTPGTITGHLLDGGSPVPNVSVDVIDPNFNFAGSATTDATGAFTVTDVTPGAYLVQFSLPGGLTQFSHSKTSFNSADLITVTSGATTSVEEAVVPHGSIGGTLLSSAGAPVANASVQVTATDFSTFLNGRTDASGHYLVPYVLPGIYTVTFTDPATFIGQTAHNHPAFSQGDPFTVTAGATTTVDEQFIPLGTVTGHVTTADGLPAAGVEVFATSSFTSRIAVTDANGNYSVTVFPGPYKMSFEIGPGGLIQWAHQQRSAATAATFDVASGGTTVVDEQLLPTGTLAGHLVDSNGQPVPFGNVQVTGENLFLFGNISNGNWQLPAYPGTYTVSFSPFGGSATGTQWATGKSSATAADHFTVQAGQTTRVDDTLAVPGTVTVTVTDALTGVPLGDACGQIGQAFACTDASGTATSAPLLPGDAFVDLFPSDGHLEVTGTATVVSGQNTALALTSVPGASITTTVRDSKTGAPLRNICLIPIRSVSPSGATAGIGNCTDTTGTFTITGLRADSYNIFAYASDGVHGHQWVGPTGGTGLKQNASVITLTAGQAVTIPDIRMDKAGILTGVIRDKATGAGIAGAIASWGTSAAGLGGSNADVIADANGRYTFTNLGPYNWPIFYHAFGYASEWSGNTGNRLQAKAITVKAGKTRTHNEILTTGVTLTGLVTDRAGQPIPQFGARITLFNADSGDEIGSDDTGVDSTYTLQALPRQSVLLNTDFFTGEANFNTGPIKIQKPGPIVVNLSPPQG